MAVRHGYGKIAGTDALVFAYDTGDTRNSYRGEPTTNIATTTPTQGGWGGTYSTLSSEEKSFRFIITSWSGTPGAAWRSYLWDVSAYTGQAVTISATFESADETTADFSFILIGQTTGTQTYLGYSSEAQRNTKTTTTRERISWSGTVGDGQKVGFTVWADNGTGTFSVDVSNVQIEIGKSHPTPFVNGTRSATQGLLDLTGNSTIDLSNVSFDSNAQKTFDGTDDYTITSNLASKFSSTSISQFITVYPVAAGQILTELGQATINTNWHDVNIDLNSSGQFLFSIWHGSLGNRVTSAAKAFNQWYHLGFTYDGTTLTAYINGESIGTTTFTRNAPYNNGYGLHYAFGANDATNMSSTAYFEGKIETTHIYNRALTPSEVQSNYRHYKKRFNI